MTSRAAFCGLLEPPSHRFTVAKDIRRAAP
jgi:hypothetical protein